MTITANSKTTTVRLPHEMWERFETLLEEEGLNQSEAVRMAVRELLERRGLAPSDGPQDALDFDQSAAA
jgi:Arc/MetJ-type ribon-helix-helix transcriptional regulator